MSSAAALKSPLAMARLLGDFTVPISHPPIVIDLRAPLVSLWPSAVHHGSSAARIPASSAPIGSICLSAAADILASWASRSAPIAVICAPSVAAVSSSAVACSRVRGGRTLAIPHPAVVRRPGGQRALDLAQEGRRDEDVAVQQLGKH